MHDAFVAPRQGRAHQDQLAKREGGGADKNAVGVGAQLRQTAFDGLIGVEQQEVIGDLLGQTEEFGAVVGEVFPGPSVEVDGDGKIEAADDGKSVVGGPGVHDDHGLHQAGRRPEAAGDDRAFVLHDETGGYRHGTFHTWQAVKEPSTGRRRPPQCRLCALIVTRCGPKRVDLRSSEWTGESIDGDYGVA